MFISQLRGNRMQVVPNDLKYTKTHEWVSVEDDIATIGITDHAQELLGEMVYVELPEIGTEVTSGREVSVVESVKAASDVYSPVCGEVIEINSELDANPAIVNDEPYGAGWLFKIKLKDPTQLNELLDAESYTEQVNNEAH